MGLARPVAGGPPGRVLAGESLEQPPFRLHKALLFIPLRRLTTREGTNHPPRFQAP